MKRHSFSASKYLASPLICGLALCLAPATAHAATLLVTSTADPGVGGCTAAGSGDGCTLREAITASNNQTLTPGADTINATGIAGTITLATALPALSTNMVINGPGSSKLVLARSAVAGTAAFRLLRIDNTTTSGPTVSLSGFTLTNGKVLGTDVKLNSGGAIYNYHGTLTLTNCILKSNSAVNGGAIGNDGSLSVNATLTLAGCTLTGNVASAGGGAIFNNGSGGGSAPLSITKCTFSGNRAAKGGAILNDGHSGGSATITQLLGSVLSSNVATGNGGAIANFGSTGGSATLVISESTLSGNQAVNGAAIDNDGTSGSATQAILKSTFSINKASLGGGAINNDGRNAGSATLTAGNSTFSGNSSAGRGSVVLNIGTGGSATVAIDNSTLSANPATPTTSAAIDSDGTAGSATLALGSTILSNGSTKNVLLTVNSETTFTSKNNNLCSDAAGGNGTTAPGGPYFTAGSDIRNTNPGLDPQGLKANGGLTQTVALVAGSPAINRGAAGSPTVDQRGVAREGLPDAGAFEYHTPPPSGITLTIATPTDNQIMALSSLVSLAGTAGANTSVKSVQINLFRFRNNAYQYWNGTSFGTSPTYLSATLSAPASTKVNWNFPITSALRSAMDEGLYRFYVYVRDPANNLGNTARSFTIRNDMTAPAGTITTPTDNQTVALGSMSKLAGTATDNKSVASVQVSLFRYRNGAYQYWNGTSFGSVTTYLPAALSAPGGTSTYWSYGVTPALRSAMDAGAYRFYVYFKDSSGNASSLARSFTIAAAPFPAQASPSGASS